MNKELKEALEKAMLELNRQEQSVRDEKAQILKRALQASGGNEAMIKEIDKRGLPYHIFVSKEIPQFLQTRLSFFAPVVIHHALNHPAIVCSWVKDGHNLVKPEWPNFYEEPIAACR